MSIAKHVRRISPRTWFLFKTLRYKFYNGQPEIWLVDHCMIKGALALDIGASIGLYSRELAKRAKRVVAFEANPRVAEFAKSVVPSNVAVECVALSSARGEKTLRVPINRRADTVDDLGTIEPRNTFRADAVVTHTVTSKKLDDYGFADCGFIKMDVEGHEEAVLEGGLRLIERCRPILMMELDDRFNPGIVSRVRERLGALGYAAFEFRDGCLQALNQHQQTDQRNATGNFVFVPQEAGLPTLSRWDRVGLAIRSRFGR
jgi:FkbM family methyltransferase